MADWPVVWSMPSCTTGSHLTRTVKDLCDFIGLSCHSTTFHKCTLFMNFMCNLSVIIVAIAIKAIIRIYNFPQNIVLLSFIFVIEKMVFVNFFFSSYDYDSLTQTQSRNTDTNRKMTHILNEINSKN